MAKDRWPAAMSLHTAAEYLDYDSPRVIEDLLRTGDIRAIQLRRGGDRRIAKAELDAFLERLTLIPVTSHGRKAG